MLLLFSSVVILPARDRGVDILPLTLLGTATEQGDEVLAILAEINTVARAIIDPEFKHTRTNTFNVGDITQGSLVRAVAAFVAACGFKRSNQSL